MSNNLKREAELITELKRHVNSDVLQDVIEYLRHVESRKIEELVRAKQEAVPLIQGAIQVLRYLRDNITTGLPTRNP